MEATKAKTLADLEVGDEVAVLNSEGKLLTIQPISGKTSWSFHVGAFSYELSGNRTGSRGRTCVLRVPTDADRQEIADRKDKAACEAAKNADAKATEEYALARDISADLSDEFSSPANIAALAQRIGLDKLREFAALVKAAKETP